MGAWGFLTFDNDDANDWAYELEQVHDLSLVESAFDALGEADDYLDVREASSALIGFYAWRKEWPQPG